MSIFFENDKKIPISIFSSDNADKNKTEIESEKIIKTIKSQNNRLLNFAHIVSHNLRSHTSNIQMLINLLEISNSEIEKSDLFNFLKESSLKLIETIYRLDEIICIEKDLNHLKEELNLYKEVDKAINTLNLQIKSHDIEIINKIPKELSIKFNSAYCESILLNLISNTIKYRSNKRQCVISLNSYYHDNYLVLEISDNGKGIDLERYGNKIFGMYKTFHNNPDARGIGLFITKNQIEALGGKIEVYSKLDEGTTFKVFFLTDQSN